MLQLDDMKVAICGILDQSLNAENFFSTRNLAVLYRLKSILKICTEYYEENFTTLSLQPAFKTEKKSHICDIVESNTLELTEEEKLSICLRWAGDSDDNKCHLGELFNLLNLWKIPKEYLNDILENHPVVSTDLRLYKMLSCPLLRPMTPLGRSLNQEIKEETKVEKKKKRRVGRSQKSIILFDETTDGIQSYDPLTDIITSFHNETFKKLETFSASILDSYIYVLCGNKAVFRLNYQYADSKWEKMPDTAIDHGRSAAQIAFDGSLYVIGGLDKNFKTMTAVEKFDSNAQRWTCMKDKPDAIALSTLVTFGEYVYCVGGFTDKQQDSRAFSRFTPLHDHWINLPPMRSAKSCCGATAYGYKIFAMGGMRNSMILKSLESFDIKLAQWTMLSPMLKRHDVLKAYYAEGNIYAFCGGYSDESEKYNIQRDEWSKITMTGMGRFKICASVGSV